MHECYLEQGLLVKQAKLLRKNYIKRRIMYLDIFSILPTDLGKLRHKNEVWLVKQAKLLRNSYIKRRIMYLDIFSILPTDLGKSRHISMAGQTG
jgi:hypothetical protein